MRTACSSRGYPTNVTSIKTPDEHTVVLKTKVPDARLVGGLWIYILPEHIWGKVPLDELTGAYQPKLPLVGSGPYIVTEFERSKIVRMEPNPEWRGEPPAFDEIQFIRYGSQDAAERALTLGEVDFLPEVEPATFERLGNQEGIEVVNAPTYSFTELAFNLCSEENCPDAQVQPGASRTRRSGRRPRTRSIASGTTRSPTQGTLVRRPRPPARRSTRTSTRSPSWTTRTTRRWRSRSSTTRAGS